MQDLQEGFRGGKSVFARAAFVADVQKWRKRVGVEPTGNIEDAARRF
jgi:hypothetical protein